MSPPASPPRWSRSIARTSAWRDDMMRVFAAALRLPEGFFDGTLDRHFSIMSCHHYPVLEKPPLPGQLRTGAHTDYGAMTILAATDAEGGLEVRLPDGSWSGVRPRAGRVRRQPRRHDGALDQ